MLTGELIFGRVGWLHYSAEQYLHSCISEGGFHDFGWSDNNEIIACPSNDAKEQTTVMTQHIIERSATCFPVGDGLAVATRGLKELWLGAYYQAVHGQPEDFTKIQNIKVYLHGRPLIPVKRVEHKRCLTLTHVTNCTVIVALSHSLVPNICGNASGADSVGNS
jgi:hypothetical protein